MKRLSMPAFVGDGADDILGAGHVLAAHVDAVAGEAALGVVAAALEDLAAVVPLRVGRSGLPPAASAKEAGPAGVGHLQRPVLAPGR